MKSIDIEQVRPKECPIGRDDCVGCHYLGYIAPSGNWLYCEQDDKTKFKKL